MTAAQTRILEMFRALSPEERETLLPELAETILPVAFDDLSPEVKAAIEEGLAQAERGETISGEELFGRLREKLGFSGE
jgi:hypothetical protein